MWKIIAKEQAGLLKAPPRTVAAFTPEPSPPADGRRSAPIEDESESSDSESSGSHAEYSEEINHD